MQVKNSVYPNEEQMQGFMQPGPEGPIYMVNLLKYKKHAEYEDGRETDLTGKGAYYLYLAAVSELLREFGGDLTFAGEVSRLMLGAVDDGMKSPLPCIPRARHCWR